MKPPKTISTAALLIGCFACAAVWCAGWAAPASAQSNPNALNEASQAAKAGDHAAAAAILEQELQVNENAELWNALGEAYYELERFEDAANAYTAALRWKPNFPRAKANLAMVEWALPQETYEDLMQKRFSFERTFAAQVLGSYFTGTAVGGFLLIGARLTGYTELDGQITIMAAGLVFSSMLRVPQVGRVVSFGHGASRSSAAGAILPPIIGALVVKLRDNNATRLELVHGARIGAAFSPLLATAGYHISTSKWLQPGPPAANRNNPFQRRETELKLPIAQFRF